jgi:hypothetical protein
MVIRTVVTAGLTAVTTLAVTGCAMPDLDREPWCELGTGDVEFVPLQDGDEVGVVGGIQGGDHIWGSARVVGVDWTEVTLVFELLDEDGALVTPSSTLIGELPHCTRSDEACEDGMGETVGFPVIVERVSDVVGDDITMTLTVTDREGRTATHAIVVSPVRIFN